MLPVKPKTSGTIRAMSSRNNNFSNRGQKLMVIITSSKELQLNNTGSTAATANGVSLSSIIIASVVSCFVVGSLFYVIYKGDGVKKNCIGYKKTIHRSTTSRV